MFGMRSSLLEAQQELISQLRADLDAHREWAHLKVQNLEARVAQLEPLLKIPMLLTNVKTNELP